MYLYIQTYIQNDRRSEYGWSGYLHTHILREFEDSVAGRTRVCVRARARMRWECVGRGRYILYVYII